MKITIEGTPKEIAALTMAVRKRQVDIPKSEEFAKERMKKSLNSFVKSIRDTYGAKS